MFEDDEDQRINNGLKENEDTAPYDLEDTENELETNE